MLSLIIVFLLTFDLFLFEFFQIKWYFLIIPVDKISHKKSLTK